MILAFPIMQITRFKNRAIRLFIFCLLSIILTTVFLKYHHSMFAVGIILFTTSLMFIFHSTKMIDQAFSKRYRFSFLRVVFIGENIIHSLVPNKMKDFSKEILIFCLMSFFVLVSGEYILILLVLLNLTIVKIFFCFKN